MSKDRLDIFLKLFKCHNSYYSYQLLFNKSFFGAVLICKLQKHAIYRTTFPRKKSFLNVHPLKDKINLITLADIC